MPRRRGKPRAKREVEKDANQEEHQVEKEDDIFKQEAERQSAAIRAIRDVEIEQLRTMMRLLRSNFSNEQLQLPVMQFFEENFPNLAIVRKEKHDQYEVQWKDDDGNLSMDQFDGRNLHTSLLHKLSTVYPDCSSAMPLFGGFEFSNKSVKTAFCGAENLQIKGFVLEEPSDTQMLELADTIQTPGAYSNRLSVGMTPKTLRLPKPGEMLLSVHGSPLGVYKEDNMEAIHESEDGGNDSA
ncbi:uncharacterized protein LOC107776006 [Nicotiana tabacum]|uniref:Uncharacterized protein LOC107776006 n=2 Tax=Nicotiana TaxID=4085 RepID=A0A1S3YH82_TOBAC|nr:PREDICTED: uncharacterized protein LOC104239369 [Nicotiana sylvestris]XP_016451302.1 PREDICTED: uncharacterized protein LOC107776006 [Nicotiana tabacum]